MIIKTFLLILTALMLTACGTMHEPQVVYKTVLVPIQIDERLLETNPIPTPVSIEDYMKLDSSSKRETAMTDYSVLLMTELKQCNNKIRGIKKSQKETIEKIKKENP